MRDTRIFNLSVNCDGVVSLWDSFRQRQRGAEEGEMFVDMPLTLAQEEALKLPSRQSEAAKLGSIMAEIEQLESEKIRLTKGWSNSLVEVERLQAELKRLLWTIDVFTNGKQW